MRMSHAWLATVMICMVGQSLGASTVERSGTFGGIRVHYKVVLPQDYDPSRAYPAILAFPWGLQDMRSVDMKLEANWRTEAERRGYIVVSPAAPGGQPFFEQGARVFPAFLDQFLRDYKVLGGQFHVAGASNGGLSAFFVASLYPKYFLSVTGYPGFLPESTPEAIDNLKPLCIYMYVGDEDLGWLDETQRQAARFREKGFAVHYSLENGQPHNITTLAGTGASRLFDNFERAGNGCR